LLRRAPQEFRQPGDVRGNPPRLVAGDPRIYAPTSEHERDGNDKQDADGNRQNFDGVIVWSVTV
jgi:hypothetical protein